MRNKIRLQQMSNNQLTILYSILLPYVFILNGYGIGGLNLGLGSILLVFFLLFSLLDKSRSIKTINNLKPIMLLLLYCVISLFDFLFEDIINKGSFLVAFLKLVIWALSISVLATAYFDLNLFVPSFKKFCIVCTSYLLIQNLAWSVFRVFIPNLYTIGPIHPLYEQYSQETLKEYIVNTNWNRFASFFSEPAFYGHIVIVDIVLLLFMDKNRKLDKKGVFELVFLSLGVLLSTSTAAILFLAIVISWYLISSNKAKYLLIFAILFITVFIILRFSPLKDNTSVVFFLGKLSNMDSLSRVGKSYEYITLLNTRQLIMGVGIGNTSVVAPGYLNSIATIIISYGIIGLLLFFVLVGSLMVRKKMVVVVLLVLYIIGSFQGAIAFSIHGILYLTVVMALIENEKQFGLRKNDQE